MSDRWSVARSNRELGDVLPVTGMSAAPAVVGRVTREAGAIVVRAGGRLVEEVAARCLVERGGGARGSRQGGGGGGGTRTARGRRTLMIQRRLKRCVVMVTHHFDLTNASNHGHPECNLPHTTSLSTISVIVIKL